MSDLLAGVDSLAQRIVSSALNAGMTVATAESLTGGMVSSAIASVPGASAVLKGGIVVYQNPVKEQLLGVDAGLLASAGSVDEGVARQMAEGALRLFDADVAVATTGVAGPGAHDGKPVGTVYIAVASVSGSAVASVSGYRFDGGRESVRRLACGAALEKLAEALVTGPVGTKSPTQ